MARRRNESSTETHSGNDLWAKIAAAYREGHELTKNSLEKMLDCADLIAETGLEGKELEKKVKQELGLSRSSAYKLYSLAGRRDDIFRLCAEKKKFWPAWSTAAGWLKEKTEPTPRPRSYTWDEVNMLAETIERQEREIASLQDKGPNLAGIYREAYDRLIDNFEGGWSTISPEALQDVRNVANNIVEAIAEEEDQPVPVGELNFVQLVALNNAGMNVRYDDAEAVRFDVEEWYCGDEEAFIDRYDSLRG